ncbi:unnamed protein product, partial [Phaeothamnion confervicola]
LKTAAGRFFNGSAVAAIAIAVAVLAIVVGIALAWNKIETGAGERAVAGFKSHLAMSRYVGGLFDRKRQRDADAASAAEREILVEQIRETAVHAATLEQELARLTENPVCYPASITKELRK